MRRQQEILCERKLPKSICDDRFGRRSEVSDNKPDRLKPDKPKPPPPPPPPPPTPRPPSRKTQ